MTISSGDGGVIDWTVINECIMVRAVMLTCTTVDACTKSGFGNIESICGFNVVGCVGKVNISSILPVASTAAAVSAFFSPFLEFHPLGP